MSLNKKQLSAVTYAVETLCGFAIMDTQGAIQELCKLDSRVVSEVVKSNARAKETLEFIFNKPL